jgi:Skp1 family, dimerisation domain
MTHLVVVLFSICDMHDGICMRAASASTRYCHRDVMCSCAVCCRLEFLGCAKVAHVVKNLQKGKLQEIYGVTQAMSPEEEAELKAANEWAWKHQESDVVDEEEGVTASAAADTAPAAAAEAK